MDLRFFLSLFMRQLHWFVLVVVLGSFIGIGVARILPTVYKAEGRLVVESEQIPESLAASTVRTQATEQLQIIQQRVLTRNILVEMANRLDIYADRRRSGRPPLSAEEIVADLRARIGIEVGGGPARRGPTQATFVTISFSAPTAELTSTVVNEMITLILKEDVAMRSGSARQTLEFFEQEVTRLDNELARQSAAILAFKQQNSTALPDSLDFRRSQQAAAQERLLQMTRQESQLRDQRDRMIRINEAAGSAEDFGAAQDRTPAQKQLRLAREERNAALAVLAPGNPKIRMLDQRIAGLEKVVAQEMTGSATDAQGQPMTAFDIQMAELDGQLAYLAEQKAQVQKQIDDLTVTIEATPGNAIALGTLERDYSALQDQYRKAVDSRAKAATGDIIEAMSKGQRISVLEQAVTPNEPTSPNRPMIAAAGVGGSLALGLALVALLELLKPGIRRPVDLTKGLGITAFATLPYLRTREEVMRQRIMTWGSLAVVLLVFGAGLWALHTYYMPLDLLLEQLQRSIS